MRAPELFHLDDSPSREPRGLLGFFGPREGRVKDMVIDACRWHVDAEAAPYKNRALDHFRDRYTVLLDLLRAERLLADPALGQNVSDWLGFEFRRSHLTDEGWELVRQCHG